jgi:hypothetical protein
MAQHFKDLVVWQKAMDMVTEIYKLTDSFPKHEVYSLNQPNTSGGRFGSKQYRRRAGALQPS